MSYNIDNIKTTGMDACMTAKDVVECLDDRNLPEDTFLFDMRKDAEAALKQGEPLRLIAVPNLRWCGEGSGRSFDEFKSAVVPLIRGTADAICTWEHGDSVSAFRIVDGTFEDCDVEMRVVPRRKT